MPFTEVFESGVAPREYIYAFPGTPSAGPSRALNGTALQMSASMHAAVKRPHDVAHIGSVGRSLTRPVEKARNAKLHVASKKKRLGFLDLPAEIRNQIYACADAYHVHEDRLLAH
ncbi:hypothetical protein K458DRAFT_397540 [Lentithecium fluviatile CBS 122367]|uniref:Uncharacterized protein n=1 Tax=Lentithecium fluviatile CBS 122367 TaxID=1168545 RepID=A0A6G1ICD1_9PLEO|nr:hypothetical protein K458DRAFT_397540 [Lentithecium fluviatile CBS 122367]